VCAQCAQWVVLQHQQLQLLVHTQRLNKHHTRGSRHLQAV
jgi:hypothetical protein